MLSRQPKIVREWLAACNAGNTEVVVSLNKKQDFDWFIGLYIACNKGYKDLATIMIDKGASNLNSGLNSACYYGYLDLINLLLDKGAASGPISLSSDFGIPRFAISRFATPLDWALIHACFGGQSEAALLLIEKGATAITDALVTACYKKHKDVALLMVEKGANIDKCILSEYEIDYLLGKIKNFGVYKDVAIMIQKRREVADQIIKELKLRDVDSVIYEY